MFFFVTFYQYGYFWKPQGGKPIYFRPCVRPLNLPPASHLRLPNCFHWKTWLDREGVPIRGSKVDATRICGDRVFTRVPKRQGIDLLDHVKLSLPETNSEFSHENQWLEDEVSFQMVYFERLCLFSGSVRLIGHQIAGTIQNCHITLCTSF